MMSSASISAMIRAKKKKMQMEESGAVKLSGIPEDATDIMAIKNKEEGERLSENVPLEHDENPMLAMVAKEDGESEAHEEMEPSSSDPYGEDGMKLKRKERLKKSMSMK